ncbi:MAG TPA: adenosine deaminase [Gemmatimonadaceae bacterium]|jgi:adenosine deaminase|nr:adenosine deaminase [Gemmatimonadaceae bacterium]
MPLSIFSTKLRQLPKAELHCHLDGSVRPETLLELAREYRVPMPKQTPEELAEAMRADDAKSLEDYLRLFDVTISVMQTAEALERIAYELAEDAAEDGVRYIEVRNAPILNVVKGLTLVEAVEAPLRGLRRAENDFGITGRFIVVAMRQFPAEHSLEMAQLAVEFKNDGVVAFDLAGGEKGNPAKLHANAFQYAREHNLAVTVHAGEGDGVESIRQAVHICGANRIGHGTRLIEDPDLTQYVNDRRIALEVCLTSNVQTKVADSYATHPFREYFDRGLNVTLNTDNRLMSGTTLTDEYVHAAEHLGFTMDELAGIALNGFESAFLPWEERLMLIEEVSDKIDEMIGSEG